MRASPELYYLYPDNPLLPEIQAGDIALATAQRKLAAAQGQIDHLRESNQRLNTARRALQEAARGKE